MTFRYCEIEKRDCTAMFCLRRCIWDREKRIEKPDNSLRGKMIARYGDKCLYPGCDSHDVTIDHIIPLSKGGANRLYNVQPLCEYHNGRKGRRTIDYRPVHLRLFEDDPS